MLYYLLLFLFFLLMMRLRMRKIRQRASRFAPPFWTGGAGSAASPASRTVDEMKPCARCGTYAPARLSWRKNNLYFCSGRCQEDFSRQKA